MSMRRIGVGVCLLLWLAVAAWGQANVNENLETAFYWVDIASGSDSNPGTQTLPFKTIGKAATVAQANNVAGIGSRITINPGTYREAVALTVTSQDTTLPVTIQAATNGSVILNGADIWTGWQVYTANSNIYTNTWPNKWGLCSADTGGAPFEQDIVLRREMIVVNGTPLTQVLALNQMQQGTFFVDETGSTAYIWPANGTDINAAVIEVATRPNLISIQGKSNIVVRGLTFQYANSCRTDSALLVNNSNNILVDTDAFVWNNGQGPGLTGDNDTTIQNSNADHNGQSGISEYQSLNGLWQNDSTSFNNWRGAQGAYYLWSSAGLHPFLMHHASFLNLKAVYNQTFGVHWDTDNQDITADSLILAENLLAEGLIEKDEGPLTITNSYFCNGAPTTGPNSIGLEVRNSEKVSLSTSVLNNNNNQVSVFGIPGGILVTNWETGEQYDLITQNLTLSGNTIVGGANQPLFYDPSLGGTLDWLPFLGSLNSNNNDWWNASLPAPFTVPVPINFTNLTFPLWQTLTLQDLNSVFQAPTTGYATACLLAPDTTDYWFVINALLGLQTVRSGSAVAFGTTVVPLNFAGTINLSSDGVQNIPGATATWDTQTINTSGNATLTVQTASTTPTGVYPVTMIANSGSMTKTVVGSVLVNTSVAVDPLILNFGNANVGSTSSAMTATVFNAGTLPLVISSITVTPGFAQTNTCSVSLAAAASCAITVTFSPRAVGTQTGLLSIKDVDAGSPQKITLTGVGIGVPVVTLSSSSVTFPGTNVGSVSPSQNVKLTNSGTGTLNLSSITITGLNPADFAQTNTCGNSVAVGANCTITVTFTPQATGARSAAVTITDNAVTSPQSIAVSGTGTAPAVTITPAQVNFGNQSVGTTSNPKPVKLTNSGNGVLTITSITITGTNPGDFAQTNNCPIPPSTLAVGANCTVNVTFTPTTTGTRSAKLTFTDNAPLSPQNVSLAGVGASGGGGTVKLVPNTLNFGNQTVGTKSAAKPVTLTNQGTTTLTITGITFTGTNGADFSQTNTCGSSVAAGASCTINVSFTPSAQGARSGTMDVADSGTGSPQTAALSGTGVLSGLTLAPTSLTFATQLVGTISKPQKITLTNSGQGALTINSIGITGANFGDFGQTNNCPISPSTLAPAQSCLITVTFTPAGPNTRSAAVTITDNAPGSPHSAVLTGTGTVVQLNPVALTFPSLPVGHTSPPKTITLNNTGSATLSITSVTIGGTNPGDFAQTNTCGSSVVAGGTCTISVTFTPTATGARSASLQVNDDGGGSPQTVALSGTGT